MANWKDMIAGCFGSADKLFSGHPSDQERAIDLLQECSKNGVSLSALQAETEKYLKGSLDFSSQTQDVQKYMQKNIDEQLQLIKEKFQPWID